MFIYWVNYHCLKQRSVKYELLQVMACRLFNDRPSHEQVMTIWLRDSLYNYEPLAICFGCCSCSVAHQYQYICRHRPLCGEFTGGRWIPHKWPVKRKMFPFDDVIMGMWIRSTLLLYQFCYYYQYYQWDIIYILMANGRFSYLFVMISSQVITLMSTLLCLCFRYVLIKAIFAPDFATVTFVLLASNNLCCRSLVTFFIMCQWNGDKCSPDDYNNG